MCWLGSRRVCNKINLTNALTPLARLLGMSLVAQNSSGFIAAHALAAPAVALRLSLLAFLPYRPTSGLVRPSGPLDPRCFPRWPLAKASNLRVCLFMANAECPGVH